MTKTFVPVLGLAVILVGCGAPASESVPEVAQKSPETAASAASQPKAVVEEPKTEAPVAGSSGMASETAPDASSPAASGASVAGEGKARGPLVSQETAPPPPGLQPGVYEPVLTSEQRKEAQAKGIALAQTRLTLQTSGAWTLGLGDENVAGILVKGANGVEMLTMSANGAPSPSPGARQTLSVGTRAGEIIVGGQTFRKVGG